MKILLVYNPKAANGRSTRSLDRVVGLFSARGVDIDLRLTDGPGRATELVGACDLSAYDGVVAAGGDGTLFEVLNGLMNNHGSGRPFGL